MPKSIEAIYEDGVLKPLNQIPLKEHQRVTLIIKDIESRSFDILELASHVYENLSKEDIQEMETIILDRSYFSRN